MKGTAVDPATIKRCIVEEAIPRLNTALKNHLIYCEGDLQAVVYTSVADFLGSRGFDLRPMKIANLRFVRFDRSYSGHFPDMVVFYFNDPLYVMEFKDNINRSVGREELEKDFKKNSGFLSKGIWTTVLMISITPDKSFGELAEKYSHEVAHDFEMCLDSLIKEHQIGEWQELHKRHLRRVNAFLSEQGESED